MDTWRGGEGEGEMYGESNLETYNAICKIDSGNLLYDLGTQTGLCDNLEGRNAEGDGREVLEGREIGVPNG